MIRCEKCGWSIELKVIRGDGENSLGLLYIRAGNRHRRERPECADATISAQVDSAPS